MAAVPNPAKDGLQAAIDVTKYTLTIAGAAIGFLISSDTLKAATEDWQRWILTLSLVGFGLSALGGLLVLMEGATCLANGTYSLEQRTLKYPGLASVFGLAAGFIGTTVFVIAHIWTGHVGPYEAKAQPQAVSISVQGKGVPLELHWFRNSAERRALYSEIYSEATQSVRARSRDLPAKTWGVILDVDETVLDNSQYQARLAVTGEDFSPKTWSAWVHDKKATALPGAVEFLHTVRSNLHGRVVLITNRSLDDCPDTETNLQSQALEYDAILCAPSGRDGKPVGDKNPRFAQVQNGGAGKLGELQVLAYVGDNIQDFPNLSQSDPGDLAHFGKEYFVLPNPMYGSWVSNVYR